MRKNLLLGSMILLVSVSAHADCVPDANGNYDQKVTVQTGEGGDQYVWAEGGGCVLRPVRETWAVAHNQPLMVWSKVSSSTFEQRNDLPPGVDFFYAINYVVNNIQTVDWNMEWYHAVTSGDVKTPHSVVINYKKVRGTKYIPYWEGAIWIDEVEPNVTAVRIRNQILATGQGLEEVEITIRELMEKFRTGAPNFAPLDAVAH